MPEQELQEQPVMGAIHSQPDYRDGLASAAMTADAASSVLPSNLNIDLSNLGPVMMQGKQPSCVSHAWAMLMKVYWFRQTGKVIDFSPRFLDILSAESDIPLDGGRRPRTVAKISATYGCATNATVPNNVTLSIGEYRDRAAITQAAFDEAAQYKIPGYIRIPNNPIAIRQGMLLYGALSGLFSIGNEFWLPSWADADIDPLRTPKAIVSGHEWVLKGWADSTFNMMRNHWSAAWANNGEAKYNQFAWAPFCAEAWAIATIPADVAAFLKELPARSDFHYTWNKNLVAGQTNTDIKFAQIALMILGYMQQVPADELGIYGAKTAAAVSKLQAAQGISPIAPNSIGPKTRAVLNKLFSL